MQSNTWKWLIVGLIFHDFSNGETNSNDSCSGLVVTCISSSSFCPKSRWNILTMQHAFIYPCKVSFLFFFFAISYCCGVLEHVNCWLILQSCKYFVNSYELYSPLLLVCKHISFWLNYFSIVSLNSLNLLRTFYFFLHKIYPYILENSSYIRNYWWMVCFISFKTSERTSSGCSFHLYLESSNDNWCTFSYWHPTHTLSSRISSWAWPLSIDFFHHYF